MSFDCLFIFASVDSYSLILFLLFFFFWGLKMALRLPASKAAEFAIASIGCGYDLAIDVRLKYCKESRLLDIQDGDDAREIVLPGGITIPNVSKSIKCDKGERMRFRSDVLSFQQVLKSLLLYVHPSKYFG